MEYESLGIFETSSISSALKAATEMTKIKNVNFVCRKYLGNGIVTCILKGNLGALQEAIQIGKESISDSNDFRHSHIIPLPHKALSQKFNFNSEQL